MRREFDKRIARLEVQTTSKVCAQAQVIIYDQATGEPLTQRDPTAIKTIWIPGTDPHWNPR